MIREKLLKELRLLKGQKLQRINLACQMIVLNFGEHGIHLQSFTRIIKNNDILLTTLDYQSWDQNISTNNDQWFYFEKFKNEIININSQVLFIIKKLIYKK